MGSQKSTPRTLFRKKETNIEYQHEKPENQTYDMHYFNFLLTCPSPQNAALFLSLPV